MLVKGVEKEVFSIVTNELDELKETVQRVKERVEENRFQSFCLGRFLKSENRDSMQEKRGNVESQARISSEGKTATIIPSCEVWESKNKDPRKRKTNTNCFKKCSRITFSKVYF